MNCSTVNTNDIQELTANEIEDVAGGMICLMILPFAAGYVIGTLIYNAAVK